ncbi:MAG: ABC transporter permease subunit, partial [Planctomycetota bacterium]|nr:ABC transporter permease subunit [Planctomycetota bacterium]
MIVGFLHVSAMLKQSLDKERFKVWVDGKAQCPELLLTQLSSSDTKFDIADYPKSVPDLEAAFKEEQVDAVLRIPADFQAQIDAGKQGQLFIVYNKGKDKSVLAYEDLRKSVNGYASEVRSKRLEGKNMAREFFEPVKIVEKNLGQQNVQLLRSLSMMLIIMALTGAFYPALDLGAGEKERGTLETLLLTPAARSEIAWGKYLAVTALAVGAGLLNVASMALTFLNLESLVPANIPQATDISINAQTIFSMGIVLVPLVSLFSALALAVSTYAASYKEGQNYLSPLMMIVIFPAMAAALPGVTLSPGMCLVPVMGASILFRDLLSESAFAYQVILVAMSNFFYAYLAIRWVATLYEREDVLMRPAAAGGGNFLPGLQKLKEIFGKAEKKPGVLDWSDLPPHLQPGPPEPTLTQSFVAFALAISVVWFVGLRVQTANPLWGQAISALSVLFIAGLGFAWLSGRAIVPTFAIHKPLPKVLAASFFLGVGVYCLNIEVMHYQRAWFSGFTLPKLSADQMKKAMELQELFKDLGPGPLVIILGIIPALCYEPFFRGFIFKGLKRDLGVGSALISTAVLGALLNFQPSLFLPTVILGVVSTLLVIAGRSIVPAIVLHATAMGIQAYYSVPDVDQKDLMSRLFKLDPKETVFLISEKTFIQTFIEKKPDESWTSPIVNLSSTGWVCGLLGLAIGVILLIWQVRGNAGSSSPGKSVE